MIKHKKIFTLALSALMVFGCVFAVTANKGNIANAGGTCSHHVGNHYTEKSPSVLEGGTAEYYICCNCHNVILAGEHTEGDGDWTNKGTAPSVDSSHRAFLEPTVTKAQVEEKFASLERTVAIDTVPTAIDEFKYGEALKYKNAYMTKKGSVEADLVGIDNFYGASNVLSYRGTSLLPISINEYNVKSGWQRDAAFTFDQTDSETGLKYTRLSTNVSLVADDLIYYYQGSSLVGLPDSQLQVLVRSNFEVKVSSRVYESGGADLFGPTITLPANEWVAITFSKAQVALAKKLSDEASEGPGKYYGNGVRIQNREALASGHVLDFTGWYTPSGTKLTSFNLLSNEGYNYGSVWSQGPTEYKATMNYVLQSSNPWFDGLPKAENNQTSYRDNFIEVTSQNTDSADKTPANFSWSSGNFYCGPYFSLGSAFKKNVSKMFFMLYSNMQTNILLTSYKDICRAGKEGTNVLDTTTIYKGWNMLNFTIPAEGLNVDYTSGHFFQLVPSVWKAGLSLTLAGLFYKEVNDQPATFSVKVNKDDAKIINFTDCHVQSAASIAPGSILYRTITTAMSEANPDVVTFSGDNAWFKSSTMSEDYTLQGYQDICDLMDTYEVPYFFTLGNHDRENDHDVASIKAVIDGSEYGHIALSPEGVGHDVNYSVDIFNKNDKLIHTLIVMDTGSYKYWGSSDTVKVTNPVDGVYYRHQDDVETKPLIYGHHYYDNADLSQVSWYEEEVARILDRHDRASNAKSSLVLHIPFLEYHFAFEKYQDAVNKKDTATIAAMQPVGNNIMVEVGVCGGQFGLFDKLKTLGHTTSVICGHDHKNDFSLVYEGVRLTYGVKTGNNCYWEEAGTMNGYTATSIASDGTVTTTQNYIPGYLA